MISISGKIAVVTGGTQGLGAAIAQLFAQAGAAGIVIVGRGQEKGQAWQNPSPPNPTFRFEMVSADLSDIEDVRSVIPAADTSTNPRRERPPAPGSVNRCVCDGALFARLGAEHFADDVAFVHH